MLGPAKIPDPNRISNVKAKASFQAQFEQIGRAIATFAKETGFEGVVGVGIGKHFYTKEVGYTSKVGISHIADKLFPICSISKTFTAASILRLVDQGLLSLDTKLSDLF